MKKLKFWILVCGFALCTLHFAFYSFAQENLEEVKDKYFQEHNYAGFIEYLKDFKKENPKEEASASYYIALSRYEQLKYLEENQIWSEYFNFGNDYRDELVKEAKNTVNLTSCEDSLNLYARVLLWQFHKDQEDAFVEEALGDLMSAVTEYSSKKDDSMPLKYIADKLYSYGNKQESNKLYGIYVDKLLKTKSKDEELKKAAQQAQAFGNTSLAIIIYDAYIDRIIKSYPKDKSLPLLVSIAKDFAYKDQGSNDPEYAERLFKKIEEMGGGDEILDEETCYIRAYNLEKSKNYKEAKDKYIILIEKFPQTRYYGQALFKCGIITTYILRDIEAGRAFFEKLAEGAEVNPYNIASVYQLGLLSQWKKDLDKAKEYYDKLMKLTGGGYGDTRELTEARLKELEKDGELEYNLKIFLDASFVENFDMTKIDLKVYPYKILKEQDTQISANIFLPETGCMAVEVNYLWSGHLGKIKPAVNQPEFATSYIYPGAKEINLVVVSPLGIVDRSIVLVDVE